MYKKNPIFSDSAFLKASILILVKKSGPDILYHKISLKTFQNDSISINLQYSNKYIELIISWLHFFFNFQFKILSAFWTPNTAPITLSSLFQRYLSFFNYFSSKNLLILWISTIIYKKYLHFPYFFFQFSIDQCTFQCSFFDPRTLSYFRT